MQGLLALLAGALLLVFVGAAVTLKIRKWVATVVSWSAGLQRQFGMAVTALVQLERRAMEQNMTGAETAALLVDVLDAFDPAGPRESWRNLESRQMILDVQAKWSRSCRKWGVIPTDFLWSLQVEACYRRARLVLEASRPNRSGERIVLEEKIGFWRSEIPEARGRPGVTHFLTAQRVAQLEAGEDAGDDHTRAVATLKSGPVLFGDLVNWSLRDLEDWSYVFPGSSPTWSCVYPASDESDLEMAD